MSKETVPLKVSNQSEEGSTPKSTGGSEKDNQLQRWLAKNRSLVLRQTPFWAQSITCIVIGLGGIVILGGYLFKIDEVVTVNGQLEPISGTTDIKTPVGGKISKVFISDGDIVKKGELLLAYDTTQASSDKATYESLITLEENELANKLASLELKKSILDQKRDTAMQVTSALRRLVEDGAYQEVQYLQQLDQLYELESNINNHSVEVANTKLIARKAIGQMKNRLSSANLQLKYQKVFSPIDGVVFDLKAVEGGVLASGETILKVIPQTDLQAKVYVPNKDIGFVRKNQKTRVRVDAFPFARYGELDGYVTKIGADALKPDSLSNYYRYPVTLNLNRSYLGTPESKISLRSGMAITANLKLREKRVLSLLSDLLVDQTDSLKSIRQQ